MKTKSVHDIVAKEINTVLNKSMLDMTMDDIRYLASLSNERITAAELHQKFRALSDEAKKQREASQE